MSGNLNSYFEVFLSLYGDLTLQRKLCKFRDNEKIIIILNPENYSRLILVLCLFCSAWEADSEKIVL